MSGLRFTSSLVAAGLMAGLQWGAAAVEAPRLKPADCFRIADWHGWKAATPDLLYVRVGMHDVYRIDLSAGSPLLRAPGVHLVTKVWGSDLVCDALDLDIKVADQYGGARDGLIAKSITKLTPDEIKAIPPEFQP